MDTDRYQTPELELVEQPREDAQQARREELEGHVVRTRILENPTPETNPFMPRVPTPFRS
jgi:hypothetical protein